MDKDSLQRGLTGHSKVLAQWFFDIFFSAFKGIRENYVKMWYKAVGVAASGLQRATFVISWKNIPINIVIEVSLLYL